VRKKLSMVAAGLVLAAPIAWAQDELAPAPSVEAAVKADPTLEVLRGELKQMQARHGRELDELRTELAERDGERAVAAEREQAERERLLRLYGFSDVGLRNTSTPEDGLMASQFASPVTFFLGRLNLYVDSHLSSDFRFLAETRLSLYPNGTISGSSATGQIRRTSTNVSDVSSPNPTASLSWGSMILERAALDWTRYPFLSVRAGLFLTPFGIYNVDHGTPTLIRTSLPIYISQKLIPERQLGIQLFGSRPVERWELGYAATVSNGRTDGVVDVDDGKAFGGRLFAKRHGELRLMLGASALYQPYRRQREQFGMDGSGNVVYTTTRVVELEALTLGGDLSLDYAGLRVRSEVVYYKREYRSGMRDAPAQARGGQEPDFRALNLSLTVAYRWWRLEPYATGDVFKVSPTIYLGNVALIPGLGVNLYLRTNVILKASWTHARFYADDDLQDRAARQNFHTLVALLTWAF